MKNIYTIPLRKHLKPHKEPSSGRGSQEPEESEEFEEEELDEEALENISKKSGYKINKNVIISVSCAAFILLAVVGWLTLKKTDTQEAVLGTATHIEPKIVAPIEEAPTDTIVEHTVSEGDIPAEVFFEYAHWDANDVAELLEHSDVYDFTRLTIGRELRFFFAPHEDIAYRMEYDRNTETMVVAVRDGVHFSVEQVDIDYDIEITKAGATIERFLYVDAMDAGISEATVLEMGDIFSFDIDFTTEIRTGDDFRVVYEKRTRDGEAATDGNILAAKFTNDGKSYYAYHFESDGYAGYYDSDGRELEKQFLRAPLNYRKITSGFTGARLHPITRKVTEHYQIDYAAPIGTPVVATAHGTVTSAGWANGWGNIVRLKHDNGYTTHYAHLSAFAKGIQRGDHVRRGSVIGYVGSTGWSTGPHLDYGMRLDGAPVNPLALKLPKGEPLAGDKMEAFKAIQEKYKVELDQE